MKKLSLLVAATMLCGLSYAGEGKACCKKGEKCNKSATATKTCNKDAKGEAKACCQKKSESSTQRAEANTQTPAKK